jgi:hypothetical protein
MYSEETSGGVDWRGLFISKHQQTASLTLKKAKDQVLKLLQSSSLSLTLYKPLAAKFALVVKVNKAELHKGAKDVFCMDNSLCVRHILETASSTVPALVVSLASLRFEVPPSPSKLLVQGEEFRLLQSDHAVVVAFNSGEIAFVAWNLHYVFALSRLVKFQPQPRFTDHDSKFGLLGYYVIVEIRTGGSSIARGCFRSVDFEVNGEFAETTIDTVREGMRLKADYGFAWQSTAFSNKFREVAVFDVTLKTAEGEPIWYISQAALLARDPIDPSEGAFTVGDVAGTASFAAKKLSIRAVQLRLKCSFLASLFINGSLLS